MAFLPEDAQMTLVLIPPTRRTNLHATPESLCTAARITTIISIFLSRRIVEIFPEIFVSLAFVLPRIIPFEITIRVTQNIPDFPFLILYDLYYNSIY